MAASQLAPAAIGFNSQNKTCSPLRARQLSAMKLFVVTLVLAAVNSASGILIRASTVDLDGCEANAKQWLHEPMTKDVAIASAVKHCESGGSDVCANFRDLLGGAFRRQATDTQFTAPMFCRISEDYAAQMTHASQVSKMVPLFPPTDPDGNNFDFELSNTCKQTARKAMGGSKSLPANKAPNFWYSLCVNQDCAHFLPSRTRWCTASQVPTHGFAVCESLLSFVKGKVDGVSVAKQLDNNVQKDFNEGQLCRMYEDFVEDAQKDYEAYQHVVHKKALHKFRSDRREKSTTPLMAIPNLAGLTMLALLCFLG
jgi:hypothetical protein